MSNPIIENAIFESKLIDLFSKIDISEVETDYPDEDIEKAMNAVHDGFGLGA